MKQNKKMKQQHKRPMRSFSYLSGIYLCMIGSREEAFIEIGSLLLKSLLLHFSSFMLSLEKRR